ncbi:hypothetical protein [Euzebya sp.]|uniref:phage major capsid protein n=1 Tax=Euzebya sp. TaxID=1971409 RepID=UPI00351731FD
MKNLAVRALTRLLAPFLMPVALARGLVSLLNLDVTYPPRPGTIDEDGVAHISEFLKDPAMIARRMRDIADKIFVGDKILRGRASTASGTVSYGQSESIYADAAPEVVAPGGVYPTTVIAAVARIWESMKKVGLATEITLESVEELRWDPVDRAIRKLKNRQIQAFDLRVIAKIVAAFPLIPTVTGSDWGSATTAAPVKHVLQAIADIRDLQEGYDPDTLLLDHDKFVEWVANPQIMALLARYAGGDADFTVSENSIFLPGANLTILSQPTGTGITDPLVFDSTQLGSIVRKESDPAEDDGVKISSKYFDENEVSPGGKSEAWRLTTKREREPIVQEPQAAVRITGT